MYGCESWSMKLDHQVLTILNCVLKTLESPLETARKSIVKEINPEYSLEGLMQKAEAPILCLTNAKSQLIRKDPDAGRDWRQEKGMTEDEIVGWHHWLNGHKFEQALGDGKGQGRLVYYNPWGLRELDMAERLKNKSCHHFQCFRIQRK